MAMWAQPERGDGTGQQHGGGSVHGCDTWPCGHGKEWRWHRARMCHEATKHGKAVAMAQCGCGSRPCGHSTNTDGTQCGCAVCPPPIPALLPHSPPPIAITQRSFI